MIIDFSKIETAKVREFLGGKGDFFIRSFKDDLNNIMCDTLAPGASVGYHKHFFDSEVMLILKGTGEVKYNNEIMTVKAGDCHYCPKGQSHSLTNTSSEELVFFAVVCNQ